MATGTLPAPAVVELYDDYADRVYDFCWSLLRDPEQAAEAAERALILAARQLQQVKDMEPLRPWLYAVAHRQVLELRGADRDRAGAGLEMPDLGPVGEEPDEGAEQAVQRELLWRAAAGLSERDQALLTLHLRHGLDGVELGLALGVDGEQARVLASRLRDQVERSLGALLVGRLGRRDCAELAKLLEESGGRFSLLRKRVTRHVDRCRVCAAHRGGADPFGLLATVPLMPAPPELRERVLEAAGSYDDGAASGVGPARPARRRGRRLAAAAVVLLVALAGGGAALWSQREGPAGTPSGSSRNTAEASTPGTSPRSSGSATGATATGPGTGGSAGTGPTTSAGATSTAPPSSSAGASSTGAAAAPGLAVSPAAVTLGAGSQTATLTLRNPGAGTVGWGAASSAGWLGVAPGGGSLAPGASVTVTLSADRTGLPEGTQRASIGLDAGARSQQVAVTAAVERAPRVSASASPSRIRTLSLCGPTTATVRAAVSDESALASVVLEWGDPVTRTAMARRGGAWQARVGSGGGDDTVRWRVVATDSRGNAGTASGTVDVDSCLLL